MLRDKKILILGGTGTLGNALTDEFLSRDVHSIRIFARNEYKMWEMRQKYGEPTDKMRYFIGDIRDRDRLDMAFRGVDICVNCAALKHVGLTSENPFEAIRTNILGVQNALECAVSNNVKTFIQISTDKAVNPVNLYGCTKATAEHIILNAPNWQGVNHTKFAVVRSGNILGSSGSVLEIWKQQKEQGLPLTVTDLNAVRYGAPKEKIAHTIANIAEYPQNVLYVLKMPKYSIRELLAQDEFKDCKYTITSLKDGEKMEEILYREGEKFIEVEV